MQEIHQTSQLNPSRFSDKYIEIGLPFISSISLSFHCTSFSFNNVTSRTKNMLSFSLENLNKKLHRFNYFKLQSQIAYFSFSKKIGKRIVMIDFENKTDFRFGFSKDVIGLLVEGNADRLGSEDPMKLSLYSKLINYNQLSFGLSKKINNKYYYGARIKLLQGLFNISLFPFNLDIYTNPAPLHTLVSKGELNLRMSFPVEFQFKENGFPNNPNIGNNILKELLLNKNYGLAFDIGFTGKLSNKVSIEASICDVGGIFWQSNTKKMKLPVNNNFEGIDITDKILHRDTTRLIRFYEYRIKTYSDSVLNNLNLINTNNAYLTMLTTNIYIAVTYNIARKVRLHTLLRTEIFNRRFYPTASLSMSFKIASCLKLHFSTTAMNHTILNAGIGILFEKRKFQFYFVSDKIPIFFSKLNNIPIPLYARSLDFKLGSNIKIDRKKNSSVRKYLKNAKDYGCPAY